MLCSGFVPSHYSDFKILPWQRQLQRAQQPYGEKRDQSFRGEKGGQKCKDTVSFTAYQT